MLTGVFELAMQRIHLNHSAPSALLCDLCVPNDADGSISAAFLADLLGLDRVDVPQAFELV
ncbi:MAG: hypothetical protein KDI82_16705, partial [Gammaproteobacteria bacterium]|nr:hypothetical protein [Gammaproteobacteria bacterium]